MPVTKGVYSKFSRVVCWIAVALIDSTVLFCVLLFLQKPSTGWSQEIPDLPSSELQVNSESPGSLLTFPVKKIEVIGNTVFRQDEISAIVKPYEGRDLTLNDLLKVRSQITQLYIDHGFITSGAYLPDQDLSNGVVQISILEGTLPKIEIEGIQRINPEYVRYRVQLGITRPFNVEKLESQLNLLESELLFKNIESVLKAGEKPGESVLIVNVTEVDYAEISILIEKLKSGKTVEERLKAVEQLMKVGAPASISVALGELSAEIESAIPQLITGLRDSDSGVRSSAALILGKLGAVAKTAIPDLTHNLRDSNEKEQKYIVSAIESIAIDITERENTISIFELNQVISDLEEVLRVLQSQKSEFTNNEIAQVSFPLEILRARRNRRLLSNGILRNPWLWGTGIYLISILGFFWIRPLWLLKVYNLLKPIGFKIPILGTDISLGFLLFPKYYPRVLDSWVTAHIKSAKENFLAKHTVHARHVYISTPVILDGSAIPQLDGSVLRSKLDQKRSCLLIWGEGGIGKTSLAIQIAMWAMADSITERLCKHKMIPVLIEVELDREVETGESSLLRTIQGQLQDLTNQTDPISEELLERLLREKRI